MGKIYLDSNIYMDYFDGRVDYMRPLGEFAFQLISRAIGCEFHIIVSGWVLKELDNNGFKKKGNELMQTLKEKGKLIETITTKEDKQMADKISKERSTPFPDTLHAVIARRTKAEFLVTRNMRDFFELQDIITIRCPENL